MLAADDSADRPGDPVELWRPCAGHHLRHPAALPLARRLAECRQGAGMARGRARKVRLRRRGNHHRRASHAVQRQCHHRQHHPRPAPDQRRRLDGVVRRASAGSTRCCASAPISPRSTSLRATSTAPRSRIWRAAPTSPSSASPKRRSSWPAMPQAPMTPAADAAPIRPCIPMSASSSSARAGRNWRRRSATGRRSADFNRAFTARPAGWASSCRSSLLTVLLLVLTGNALAHLGLSVPSIMLMLALFAVPASEGALAFFNDQADGGRRGEIVRPLQIGRGAAQRMASKSKKGGGWSTKSTSAPASSHDFNGHHR